MRSFLLSLPEKLQAVIVIGSTIASAFIVAIIVSLLSDIDQLEHNMGLSTSVYGVLGTLYAVLLAFAVSGVWQSFSKAIMSVQTEADTLADLVHSAENTDDGRKKEISALALAYTMVVINQEWATLSRMNQRITKVPELSRDTSTLLTNAVLSIQPINDREVTIFAQALMLLNNWLDARRTRLMLAQGDSARALWPLLISGALVLFAFHGLFTASSTFVWSALLLGLSFIIGLAFYLIFSLDCPFIGSLSVSATPFDWGISLFDTKKKKI